MASRRYGRLLPAALLVVAALTAGCDLAASTEDARTAVKTGDAAADLGTQTSLRNVAVAAAVLFSGASSYDAVSAAALAGTEPGFCFVGPTTASVASGGSCEAGGGSQPISVFGSGQTFAAAAMSSTGRCFWIRALSGAIAGYGSGEPCTGTAATAAANPGF